MIKERYIFLPEPLLPNQKIIVSKKIIIKSGDNLKDNIYQRKYEPGKKYIIGHGSHVSGKDDEEDLKEEKGPGQQKSSTGNYVIRSQIKDDKSNKCRRFSLCSWPKKRRRRKKRWRKNMFRNEYRSKANER